MINFKKIFLFVALFFTSAQIHASKKRNVIPVQTITLGQLFKNIGTETSALFYLVDKDGNPLDQQNLEMAIGSKSLKIPNENNLSATQKNLLNSLQITIEENAQRWIQIYLDKVKDFRSEKLSGNALETFNTSWNSIYPSYTSLLTKILHTMTLSKENAQSLNFVTKNNKAVTFFFFDDPFPAHTVPGNAKNKMKDLLAAFIKRYQK